MNVIGSCARVLRNASLVQPEMTASSNIRNHPYTFEHALQHSADYTPPQVTRHQRTGYFTWLVFMEVKWVPFDASNQYKLEQTLNLGGTFVDIQDSHFPGVKRVRAFPKSNYISYLGVKYRLSRVMQPDAWIDPPDHDENSSYTPIDRLQAPFSTSDSTDNSNNNNTASRRLSHSYRTLVQPVSSRVS
ncbi:hypothetical protein BJV82DRAFT_162641 [Fennellomyces sp. T-0311]|nr:hypothetical protein BJV82DRAFT_162641 [Fennellomyces sp. T-0311]